MVKNVFHDGFMSHDEVLNFQDSCDFLLLTSAKVIRGKDYSIAGKTFEYLTAQKPILAFVCDGAQKYLIEKTGIALVLDPDEWENNAQILQKVYKDGIKLMPQKEFIKEHTRMNLAKRLVELLFKILLNRKMI